MKIMQILEEKLEQKKTPSSPSEGSDSPSAAAPAEASRQDPGLSREEAARRLKQYGKNELKSEKKTRPMKIFLGQYKDIMTIILLVCTAVSLFMGEYVEAIAIAVIVLMNGILGFIQEYRTERTLEALKGMAAPMAKVRREGGLLEIPASEIVPGDIVLVEAGDRIPADGRLLSAAGFECNESMLTGESIPVKKQTHSRDEKQKNLYMGCIATKGHASFTVTKTGMQTEMGGIASMLQNIEENETPLQKKLAQLSKYIAAGCLLICGIVSLAGILRGENFLDMLITGISLAVAAVPEGLPAIVTISLALSVSRMVKRNALVRRLHAVETLGCATVICSDKTGTITQNRMTATEVCTVSGPYSASSLPKEEPAIRLLLHCVTLCSNAVLYPDSRPPFGGHTEVALLQMSAKYGCTREGLAREFLRKSETPFDSTRKRMSVVVEDPAHKQTLFVKGAFDLLLDRCTQVQDGSQVRPLTPSDKRKILTQSERMADQALRVIAAAYRPVSAVSPGDSEEGLIFLGLVGMIDPPRKEVRKAVSRCQRAGIRTVMITGDHKKTAAAIAKQVGIWHEGDRVVTGEELDRMSVDQLAKLVPQITVFARVSPNHKLQIVKALKKNGQIVAMTGDGVNDAPAIKEADIGVSMGEGGTDVTKEASEIILLDDNFATLVGAIEEGRGIYENIRKFIRYLLACNIGEVLTMFLGMLMGMPVILFPIQILLVNLVTDGLPAIALGLEPSDPKAMSRPPRRTSEGVFSRGLAGKIILRGILIGFSTLASFITLFHLTGSVDHARTAALFALVFAQLIHVFECKSEEKNLLHIPYGNNKKLLAAVGVSMLALFSVLYIEPLRMIFATVPLTLNQLLIPACFCLIAPLANILLHRQR